MNTETKFQIEEKTCKWRHVNNGMYGCDNYEWETECEKTYDAEKTNKENYCPHCGGKII